MVSMLVIIVIIIGTQWVIIMRPSMLVIIMIVIAIALGDHIFPQFPQFPNSPHLILSNNYLSIAQNKLGSAMDRHAWLIEG